MPQAASKKQYRFMMAIMHGKGGTSKRGDKPPKSVASKYSSPGKGAPEDKGKAYDGGKWDEKNKSKDKKRTKQKRQDKAKNRSKSREGKKKLKKSFEQYYRGQGAGTIVVDDNGKILVGISSHSGQLSMPGGHVDSGETYEEAAARELKEEAGISASNLIELGQFKSGGNDSKVFLVKNYKGKPKSSDELKSLTFMEPHVLADSSNLRECCKKALDVYLSSHLVKTDSLRIMVAKERLAKAVLRGQDGRHVAYDISHGEALKLVGNGCFRMLKRAVEGMGDEDFRDVKIDTHTISIRKHMNDVYSGRVNDGHKTIHQFTNKSLPQLCADIMSLFEWYSDEDEHVFDLLHEESLSDDAILGGLGVLTDNYKKHNLGNIYSEMQNIREEIRHGMAVDLQQVEHKIMSLFDKLEETIYVVTDKHNELAREAGKELEALEFKLRDLQSKLDELSKKPTTVEAYQSKPVNPDKVYSSHYMYLPKPSINVGADGRVSITFQEGWTDMEKSNFLNDMKAKILKKKRI
jgi:ADP-ribose pyrophosphatase YjhB (NUDIX family)